MIQSLRVMGKCSETGVRACTAKLIALLQEGYRRFWNAGAVLRLFNPSARAVGCGGGRGAWPALALLAFCVLTGPGESAPASRYSDAVLADGPLLYYQFNETGGTVATNSAASGSACNGTYNNVTLGVPGPTNSLGVAVRFNGASSSIAVPALASNLSSITIEAWVEADGFSTNDGHGIFMTDGWTTGSLALEFAPPAWTGGNPVGTVQFTTHDGTGSEAYLPAYGTSRWHHLVLTCGGGEANYYLDGILQSTISQTISVNLTSSHLGSWGDSRYLQGAMDEFALYTNVLSGAQVQAHYAAAIAASFTATNTVYEPNLASLAQYRVPEWFQDAKFGIFITYGPYSYPGQGCWFGHWLYNDDILGDSFRQWFNANIGPMTGDAAGYKWGYKDLLPYMTESNLDVNAWADLFVAAGAKYVVPVALFHDGFAMYDSKYTRWNAVNMGPHRDYITQLGSAARARGLKFGVANHYFENWLWYHHDTNYDTGDPQYYDLYNVPEIEYTGPSAAHCSNWLARAVEMVDKWHPDLMWFDWNIEDSRLTARRHEFAAYYYNAAVDWQSGVVLNYKYNAFPQTVAVLDYERGQSGAFDPHPWQTDTSTFNDWSYIPHPIYRTPQSLIQSLADIVSKNGCLLLSVGPEPDGTIPTEAANLLLTIGSWLSTNGEAIYATRPCFPYAEGTTVVPTGGFTDGVVFNSTDIRFSRNKSNNTVYAIGLAGQANGQMLIKSMKAGSFDASRVASVSLLGGDSLAWSQDAAGLKVQLPPISFALPYTVKISKLPGAANPVPVVVQQTPLAGSPVGTLTAIEVCFNEAVTNVQASDLWLGGVAATSVWQVASNDYIFQFPPAPAGLIQVTFSPTQFIEDLAWNAFAGATWTNVVDPNQPPPPVAVSMDQQPSDAQVFLGEPVTFTAHATATGTVTAVTYQWLRNGIGIVGATNAAYQLPAALQGDDRTTFTCLARAPGTSAFVLSRSASLTVAYPHAQPLSWLTFDGTLADSGSSTNDRTAAFLGGADYSGSVANTNCGTGSASLPGARDSYVLLTNVADLNFSTGSPFTLSAWIKTTQPGVIAAKSMTNATAGAGGTHTPAFSVDASGALRYDVFWVGSVLSSAPVNRGQWTHVAVTCDGGKYQLYINGLPDGVASFGGANDGANGEGPWKFTVGATLNPLYPQWNGVPGGAFIGEIDEVVYWSTNLASGQIFYVAQHGAAPVVQHITATAGPGGSISPSGSVSVNYGAGQSFSITASNGFNIAGVVVDGISQDAVNSFTFADVIADHTISAAFAAIPQPALTISADPTGGLAITWSDILLTNLVWSPVLGPGAVWVPVVSPAHTGGVYRVTIPPSNSAAFYYLRP